MVYDPRKENMTIALDFDDTLTADPEFWWTFAALAEAHGHRVVIVTYRLKSGEFAPEVDRVVQGRLPVVWTERQPKRPAADAAGYEVDIWIDDMPELIGPKKERKKTETMKVAFTATKIITTARPRSQRIGLTNKSDMDLVQARDVEFQPAFLSDNIVGVQVPSAALALIQIEPEMLPGLEAGDTVVATFEVKKASRSEAQPEPSSPAPSAP